MSGEPLLTLVGNLTGDPELRFTPSGAAVATFTIASTPRTFDKTRNEWIDGETLFMRCSVWRDYAENVAETLAKGARVIAQGRLKARSYDDKDGNRRTVWELDVDEIGPALRYATAKVTKTQRNTAPADGSWTPHQTPDQPTGQQAPPQQAGTPAAGGAWGKLGAEPVDDPWATGQTSTEPPF